MASGPVQWGTSQIVPELVSLRIHEHGETGRDTLNPKALTNGHDGGSDMNDVPEYRYVRSSDGTSIAYQVMGRGSTDLVYMGGEAIDLWEDAGFLRFTRRLGNFARMIWVHQRGWGGSEGDPRDIAVAEITNADMSAVLDAEGIDQIGLVGWSGSGQAAMQFCAAYPQKVSALILIDAYAHYVRENDYPWGIPKSKVDGFLSALQERWGSGADLSITAPGRADDERYRAEFARSRRVLIGRDAVVAGFKVSLEADLRPLLPSITTPTLVLHREGDRLIRPGAGRYLADHIAGAKFVLLPGDEHLYFAGDIDALVDEIEEFLTGARSSGDADVVMSAILFTDIVGSTEHQARVGSREWSRLMDEHDARVRGILAHYRGREVKTTGDGFLVTFDSIGRALRCATDVLAATKVLGLELRAGVHVGDMERRGEDIAGMSVTIAKRVCDLAGPTQVLVSEAVPPLVVGAEFEFDERGEYTLKGVPGSWRLFAVRG
jgi:class 3 adenylate cyclase